MPNIIFDPSKIKHVLKAIKSSSPGPDNLHPFALKNLSDELAIPLSIIFTKSYQLSALPSSWLTSLVCPIYKGFGPRTSADNYRPVSLTSLVCKTMETIIKDSMLEHLMSQSNHSLPAWFFYLNDQPYLLLYRLISTGSVLMLNPSIHTVFTLILAKLLAQFAIESSFTNYHIILFTLFV